MFNKTSSKSVNCVQVEITIRRAITSSIMTRSFKPASVSSSKNNFDNLPKDNASEKIVHSVSKNLILQKLQGQ